MTLHQKLKKNKGLSLILDPPNRIKIPKTTNDSTIIVGDSRLTDQYHLKGNFHNENLEPFGLQTVMVQVARKNIFKLIFVMFLEYFMSLATGATILGMISFQHIKFL
jgi:hypothetical protein